jgi:hypothetical protein
MDTSVFSELNWLAVLVAGLAYFALGAIWYSGLFSKQWVAYHNIAVNEADKKGMAAIMLASLVWMLVASLALGILVTRLDLRQVLSGVKLGLFTGICFSFMAISVTYLYLKKPVGLHLIDGMYHVTGQVIAAVILCLWR